jgi:type IV pilus assembly protein PilB
VTSPQVESAHKHSSEHKCALSESLIALKHIEPRTLALVRAGICECPFADLDHYQIDIRNTQLLPRPTSESLHAFPLFVFGESATMGMANPLDLKAVDQLRAVLKLEIEPVLCEPGALSRLIDRAYTLSSDAGQAKQTDQASLTTGKEPVVAAVNQILAQAAERGASDVHINPDEASLHLRFRVDGTLQAQQGPGLGMHAGIVQRLKVMANLDLTQSRRPQDGKFRFQYNGRSVDVRLSIIPTVCGENVVMRMLTSAASIRGFAELGVPADMQNQFDELLTQPHGMLLVTGPTGSGKTTTLYTGLKKLNSPGRNIMTIEDPVEIRMPLIRQVQVNTEIGMTFAGALRSILRQDPDVVFVGEIRDEETARIAIQAALTGHLVLSSLHTNDAAGAVPRLRDFGCAPFAINGALLGVVAQRLVRKVCVDCSKPCEPDKLLLARFHADNTDGTYVKGAGCPRCAGTGYKGRLGVYELLRLTPRLQQMIDRNATTNEIRSTAVHEGMRLMWHDGLAKARVGLTTLSEVVRVVAMENDETSDAWPSPTPMPTNPSASKAA